MSNHPTFVSIVIVLIAGFVWFSGHKLTGKDQKQDKIIEQIENSEKLARIQLTAITSLIKEEASSEERATDLVKRWNSRYKIIPDELSSADLLVGLESLTERGFDSSEINIRSTKSTADFKYHDVLVSGTSTFASLYSLIWHLENDREFVRVFDLDVDHVEVPREIGRSDRMMQMVKFKMEIHAYFGGAEGMSADPELEYGIPVSLLPKGRPAHNSFFALVSAQLPKNTKNLVDVENDELIAVAGDRAIFKTPTGNRVLAVGEDVYLGQITSIDPVSGKVSARLNKLGVVNVVSLQLGSEERYRQALGNDRQFTPLIRN